VLLFPGQGSQKPGMGKELAAAFPAAGTIFAQADATLGFPLSELCFEGPEDELMATRNAQPALLTHGAAVWATVAAGLGLSEANVETACERAREAGDVVPANYNTPEQLVISGEVAAVERAMAISKELGAKRAIRLNVSGAFHSPLMEEAAAGLEVALGAAPIAATDFPVYSNVSTYPSAGSADAKKLLLRQLTSPVRWTELVQHMAASVPDALFVEMGPGAVLSTLVKRIVPGARTMTCGTPAEVDQLIGALPS